jgi:hypothetical protein
MINKFKNNKAYFIIFNKCNRLQSLYIIKFICIIVITYKVDT